MVAEENRIITVYEWTEEYLVAPDLWDIDTTED